MKFRITRTSHDWFEVDKPPCDGCRAEDYTERINRHNVQDRGWFRDLESLEELLEFVAEQRVPVIVGPYTFAPDIPTIEIYDDYRE